MKCPLCQLEMRIHQSRNVIENDDTPDAETKLYLEQDFVCMNKDCANYQKTVHTARNERKIG